MSYFSTHKTYLDDLLVKYILCSKEFNIHSYVHNNLNNEYQKLINIIIFIYRYKPPYSESFNGHLSLVSTRNIFCEASQ